MSNLSIFIRQKTAYEIMTSLVGSEMCRGDSHDRRRVAQHHEADALLDEDADEYEHAADVQQHEALAEARHEEQHEADDSRCNAGPRPPAQRGIAVSA